MWRKAFNKLGGRNYDYTHQLLNTNKLLHPLRVFSLKLLIKCQLPLIRLNQLVVVQTCDRDSESFVSDRLTCNRGWLLFTSEAL